MRHLLGIPMILARRALVRLDPRRALDRRRVRAVAAERLAERLGRPVRWSRVETLHGTTARAVLAPGGGTGGSETGEALGPSSVILKQMAPRRGEKRFDASLRDPMALSYRLFNEWAALDLLEELAADEPLAPRRLSGDRRLGFLLVEDLAAGAGSGTTTVAKLLAADDREKAESALLDAAGLLGRFHGLTAEHREAFEERRFELGPRTDTPERLKGHRAWFDRRVVDLRHAFEVLGFETDDDFWGEIDSVSAELAADGDLATLTHGDVAVDNVLLGDGGLLGDSGLRLIDFEFADYRLALTDAVFPRMLFPGCWLVRRIPGELVRAMEARHREALIEGCPPAADDGRYGRAVLAACATWMVSLLALSLHPQRSVYDFESVVKQDRPWGPVSRRQIVLARLDAFVEAAEEFEGLPSLARAFAELATTLRQRWGTFPDIPSFRVFS